MNPFSDQAQLSMHHGSLAPVSLAMAFVRVAQALPQLAHPGAGEPVTVAAVTQVPVTVVPATIPAAVVPPAPVASAVVPVPVVAAAPTTSYDLGLYTWQASAVTQANPTTIVAIPPAASTTADDDDDTTTFLATLTSSSSRTSSATSSASVSAAAASASSADSSTTSGGSHVVVPLLIVGAVILLALGGSIWWTRRARIRAWLARRRGRDSPDDFEPYSEKADIYRDVRPSAFDGYGNRGHWMDGQDDVDFQAIPYDRDDRYGSVSSYRRQSMAEEPVEEVGEERGWLWGTKPLSLRRRTSAQRPLPPLPDDRALLADHDHLDAMLAASRTGYLPSESSQAELSRRPSMLERAGMAVVSSLSSRGSNRSRRVAKVASYSDSTDRAPGGSWNEHGAWRKLPNDDEREDDRVADLETRAEPSTPTNRRTSNYSQVDSIRRPLMAATPDTAVSRSVRRWQLTDGPVRTASPSPSVTTRTVSAQRQLPPSLRPASPDLIASPPISPGRAPDMFYAASLPGVPMPPPMREDGSHMSLSHIANLIFPGASAAEVPAAKSTDAFGPYTSLPVTRQRSAGRRAASLTPDRTPTKVARQQRAAMSQVDSIVREAQTRTASPSPPKPRRGGGGGERMATRQMSRSSTGSLTDLVASLLANEKA